MPLEGSFTPTEDGNYIAAYSDEDDTLDEIRRHSKRDADIYPVFSNMMYEMAKAVRPILTMVPPDPANPGGDENGRINDRNGHQF